MEITREDLLRRLARAVLAFQDSYLARDHSPVGLLCQVRFFDFNMKNEPKTHFRFMMGSYSISHFHLITKNLQVWLPETGQTGMELKTKVN